MPVIRLATVLALLCSAAAAEVTVTIVEPDATGYIGQVVHHNRSESRLGGEELLRFETNLGTFLILWTVTTNSLCIPPCPDTIVIWDWPANVIPDVIEATTPERGVTVIRLYLWEGM